MARLALGVAGGAVGAYFGQPGLGFAIGSMAGNYLFPEDLGTTKGPRLDDRSVMAADEGTDMPTGWGVIPVPGQIIWADEINETATTTETGGKGSATTSSYKEYRYTATFAVSFGNIRTEHIRRLWFNGELIVDNRPGVESSKKPAVRYTEYLGTATQEPDADIESIVGTGNAPAYRGQTYIVFRALALEPYGNRIPSISAELITDGTTAPEILDGYIWEDTTSQLSPNMELDIYNDVVYYSEFDTNSGVDFIHKLDPYTGAVLQNFGPSVNTTGAYNFKIFSFELGFNNRLVALSPNALRLWDTDTGNLLLEGTYGSLGSGITRISELSSYMAWTISNYGTATIWVWEKNETSTTAYSVAPPTSYQSDFNGTRLSLCRKDDYTLCQMLERTSDSNPAYAEYTPDGTSGEWGAVHDMTMPDDEAGRSWDFRSAVFDTINHLYWVDVYSAHATNPDYYYWLAIDPANGDVIYQLDSVDRALNPTVTSTFDQGTQSIYYYDQTNEYIYQLDVITQTITSWDVSSSWASRPGLDIAGDNVAWYHPGSNRVLLYGYETNSINKSHLLRCRLDNVTTTAIPIKTIIEDVCAEVGITTAELNTTALTETVDGYRVMRRAPARSILEPVLNVHQIDVVQSDYKLKFVPRGTASALTVNGDYLACAGGDEPSDIVLPEKLPQGIDLPKSVDVQYISTDRDLQPGSVRAMWAAAGRERELSLNLGIVMDDDEATRIANVYLQETHQIREFSFTLPPYYMYLEPTDIITVPVTDTYSATVKLTQTNRSEDGLSCEAVAVDAEHYSADSVGGGSTAAASVINGTGTPQPVILDTDLLRDIDLDHPGPYVTAYTYGGGWLPAGVYVSSDGQTYTPQATISSEPLVGLVGATPTTGIDWEDYDTTNTVIVNIIAGSGSISSATEAQLLAGANVAAWGRPGRWEIVQWKTATNNGDGTYDIDDLLRGRRGTNTQADLHEMNDLFVVLDDNSTARLVNSTADIGNTVYYKVVPDGQPIGNYSPRAWVVGSNPLYPYSPIGVTGTDVGGAGTTLQIDWERRTRKGGFYGGTNGLTDNVGGTLSEDTEEYELDIYDSADLSTVVRAVTGLTSATYDYTSAQWAADGFVSTDTIVVRIYQISATVDRGYQSDDETLTIP